MFSECKNLTELDLSSFNTKKVTDMFYMFQGCSNLATIYVSDKFVTTRLVSGSDIFKGCEKLVGAVAYDSSKTGRAMANYDTGYFTDITTVGIPVSYAVLDNETGARPVRHAQDSPAGAALMSR
uniref:BspA family leucine-rich repeat surface protein n=1 Tax=Prevotella sp. TaxID=59823 RepID=UPI003FEDDD11